MTWKSVLALHSIAAMALLLAVGCPGETEPPQEEPPPIHTEQDDVILDPTKRGGQRVTVSVRGEEDPGDSGYFRDDVDGEPRYKIYGREGTVCTELTRLQYETTDSSNKKYVIRFTTKPGNTGLRAQLFEKVEGDEIEQPLVPCDHSRGQHDPCKKSGFPPEFLESSVANSVIPSPVGGGEYDDFLLMQDPGAFCGTIVVREPGGDTDS